MFKLLVVISVLFSPTSARRDGAPAEACENRTPSATAHGAAQTTSAPYTVTTGASTYTPGTAVQGRPIYTLH